MKNFNRSLSRLASLLFPAVLAASLAAPARAEQPFQTETRPTYGGGAFRSDPLRETGVSREETARNGFVPGVVQDAGNRLAEGGKVDVRRDIKGTWSGGNLGTIQSLDLSASGRQKVSDAIMPAAKQQAKDGTAMAGEGAQELKAMTQIVAAKMIRGEPVTPQERAVIKEAAEVDAAITARSGRPPTAVQQVAAALDTAESQGGKLDQTQKADLRDTLSHSSMFVKFDEAGTIIGARAHLDRGDGAPRTVESPKTTGGGHGGGGDWSKPAPESIFQNRGTAPKGDINLGNRGSAAPVTPGASLIPETRPADHETATLVPVTGEHDSPYTATKPTVPTVPTSPTSPTAPTSPVAPAPGSLTPGLPLVPAASGNRAAANPPATAPGSTSIPNPSGGSPILLPNVPPPSGLQPQTPNTPARVDTLRGLPASPQSPVSLPGVNPAAARMVQNAAAQDPKVSAFLSSPQGKQFAVDFLKSGKPYNTPEALVGIARQVPPTTQNLNQLREYHGLDPR